MKLPALIFAFILGLAAISPATAADKTNLVVILVDDLGYGDLGCYGSTVNRTPHIDQMAKDGLQFTSFYAGGCVCTPS